VGGHGGRGIVDGLLCRGWLADSLAVLEPLADFRNRRGRRRSFGSRTGRIRRQHRESRPSLFFFSFMPFQMKRVVRLDVFFLFFFSLSLSSLRGKFFFLSTTFFHKKIQRILFNDFPRKKCQTSARNFFSILHAKKVLGKLPSQLILPLSL
jgi:hypothetical protein